jgi:hypothetical protein
MGRQRKNITGTRTIRVDGQILEVDENGAVEMPGLFQPQDCDIAEEFQNNEALREFRRDAIESESF